MASVTSLDHDMRKLRLERYTPSAANEVKAWIEESLGERLQGELLDALRDGVALCKSVLHATYIWSCTYSFDRLVNLAAPSLSIKYKASSMPFTQRENISHFLTACENPPFSLPSHDRFLTVDLYDEKDPAQVIQCLGAFSRVANSIYPSRFPTIIGPRRGAPSPTRKVADGGSHSTTTPSRPSRGFSNGSFSSSEPSSNARSPPSTRTMSPMQNGGSATIRTPESTTRSPGQISSWSKKSDQFSTAPAWNIHQYGYMGGASQGNQGVVFGAPRQITSTPVQVPSAAEKEQRLKQQQIESEKEAQRRREEEEQRERERRTQREAEEEQARKEERRRWEEETRKARQREQEDAEHQRLELEKEREELRKAREEERRAVERDKEERKNFEAQRQAEEERARQNAEIKFSKAQPSTTQSTAQSSESDRIHELERQLEAARERELQYQRERESQSQATPAEEQSPLTSTSPMQPLRQAHSGGPRPLPIPGMKPALAPKPRASPFARSTRPLDPPQAEPQPRPPPGATAEPPDGGTNPTPYSSAHPQHITRTDQFLDSHPAPMPENPTSHFSQEMGVTSAFERDAEDSRRVAAQQKTKAGGWASKSLLEKEMERERERQREWEENQLAKAKASGQSSNNRSEFSTFLK